MIRSLLSFLLIAFYFLAQAQVPNNQISQRYHLMVDDIPVSSTTTNSSVEWRCINKALTNKCLVYHNDQWFSFSVQKNGVYYANLSAQVCKKKLGTQLILIEGNPCEIKTYRILKCVSQLPKDDSYIKLDSLKAGVTYLMNVDGFLADECDFAIQVSSKPSGFPLPVASKDTLEVKTELKKEIAKLTWFIEEERAPMLRNFSVLRTSAHDTKGKVVNRQPIRRNTYGAYETRYTLTDTLPRPAVYTYKIFGEEIETGELILLTTEYARYEVQHKPEEKLIQKELIIPLKYEEGTAFRVMVMDMITSEELFKYQNRFEAANDGAFKIDLSAYIDKGKKEFMIVTTDFSAKGTHEMYYRLNDKGKLVQQ